MPQCLERSKQVAEEFAGLYGGKAAAYGCDLVDAKAVAEMFDAIEKELGSVDVVHNNAGVGGRLSPIWRPGTPSITWIIWSTGNRCSISTW